MTSSAFDSWDKYVIFNKETGKAIESQPSRACAEDARKNLDDHEIRNNRPAKYEIFEGTVAQFWKLRKSE